MNTTADLCSNKYGNTGMEGCRIALEKIVGFGLGSKSLRLDTPTADATFITAIQTLTMAATKTGRLFPVMGANVLANTTDNTADATEQKAGYGQILGVFYDKHTISIEMGDVGIHVYQELFKYHHNKDVACMLYLGDNKLVMANGETGKKKLMPCQVIPGQFKFGDNTKIGSFMLKLVLEEYDALENDDKMYVHQFGSSYYLPDLVHGIHDVKLELITATTSAITVSATRMGDFANMAVEFAATIGQTTTFLVKRISTGAMVVPSGVTISALGYLVIAGTFTAGDYLVYLNTPSVLAATPIFVGTTTTGGYESNILPVTTA